MLPVNAVSATASAIAVERESKSNPNMYENCKNCPELEQDYPGIAGDEEITAKFMASFMQQAFAAAMIEGATALLKIEEELKDLIRREEAGKKFSMKTLARLFKKFARAPAIIILKLAQGAMEDIDFEHVAEQALAAGKKAAEERATAK